MGLFRTRSLGVIDRIYDLIQGDRAPTNIDLRSPITLVHDVRRNAEVSSGKFPATGGFFQADIALTHAAADTQQEFFDPWNVVTLPPPSPQLGPLDWVWLMRYGNGFPAACDPTWTLSIGSPARIGFDIADFIIAIGPRSNTPFNAITPLLVETTTGNAESLDMGMLPFPLFEGSTARVFSASAAVGVHRVSLLFWTGPIGVLPPGLA